MRSGSEETGGWLEISQLARPAEGVEYFRSPPAVDLVASLSAALLLLLLLVAVAVAVAAELQQVVAAAALTGPKSADRNTATSEAQQVALVAPSRAF